MFGFGPFEIAALVGLLVFFLGAPRAGRVIGRAWRTWRRAEEVKGQLRNPLSLRNLLFRLGKSSSPRD